MSDKPKEQRAAEAGYTVNKEGTEIRNPQGIKVATFESKGYRIFDFGPKADRKHIYVHRFQAWFKFNTTMYGAGLQVRHLDGNSRNNHADNLALGTQSQNMLDRPAADRKAHGYQTSRHIAKHDHAAVISYYKAHGFKATLAAFNISSKGTLSFILNKTQTGVPVTAQERPKRKNSKG